MQRQVGWAELGKLSANGRVTKQRSETTEIEMMHFCACAAQWAGVLPVTTYT